MLFVNDNRKDWDTHRCVDAISSSVGETLEELTLSMNTFCHFLSENQTIRFSDFSRLKKLGVDSSFLIPDFAKESKVNEVLPASLGYLELNMNLNGARKILEALVQGKSEQLPRLQKVISRPDGNRSCKSSIPGKDAEIALLKETCKRVQDMGIESDVHQAS